MGIRGKRYASRRRRGHRPARPFVPMILAHRFIPQMMALAIAICSRTCGHCVTRSKAMRAATLNNAANPRSRTSCGASSRAIRDERAILRGETVRVSRGTAISDSMTRLQHRNGGYGSPSREPPGRASARVQNGGVEFQKILDRKFFGARVQIRRDCTRFEFLAFFERNKCFQVISNCLSAHGEQPANELAKASFVKIRRLRNSGARKIIALEINSDERRINFW